MSRLTLSMIVHNEADRFLDAVLRDAAKYIDHAVIIDDASTDDTIGVVGRALQNVPHRIVHNAESKFSHEVDLRRQQWDMTLETRPDWVLVLDADEMFEPAFGLGVRTLIDSAESDAFYFRLYDMWSDSAYREDQFWSAHHYYRPFLVRPGHGRTWTWKETAQHCGRFPLQVSTLPYCLSGFRLKHLGWSRLEDRAAKYNRYMRLDPEGRHGWLDQYKSIMDPNPNLVPWQE